MNAPLHAEHLACRDVRGQADEALAATGVLRFLWPCRYGPMLIEVRDGVPYVNGGAVEPFAATDQQRLARRSRQR